MYERTNHLYYTQEGQVKAFEHPHNHVRAQMHGNIQQEDVASINVPTLIIHGELDPVVFPVNAKLAAEEIKNSQLHIMSGMGHMVFNRELEQIIADMIVAFMKKN
jgi:pimeloyl-ACP methyl ester carboxylesterase